MSFFFNTKNRVKEYNEYNVVLVFSCLLTQNSNSGSFIWGVFLVFCGCCCTNLRFDKCVYVFVCFGSFPFQEVEFWQEGLWSFFVLLVSFWHKVTYFHLLVSFISHFLQLRAFKDFIFGSSCIEDSWKKLKLFCDTKNFLWRF